MTGRILIISPNEEKLSQIVGLWLDDWERSSGVPAGRIIRLSGTKQVSSSTIKTLLTTYGNEIDIVVYYGHGTCCRLCTREMSNSGRVTITDHPLPNCRACYALPLDESLLDRDSLELLSGKSVYTVACLTQRKLGPDSVRTGAAYFGYKDLLPLRASPSALELIKKVVNGGLQTLCNEDQSLPREDRLKAVGDAVRRGFSDAVLSLPSETPSEEMDVSIVGFWKLAFGGEWPEKESEPREENL